MALQLPNDDRMSLGIAGFTEETGKMPNVAARSNAQVLVATQLTLYEVVFEIKSSSEVRGSLGFASSRRTPPEAGEQSSDPDELGEQDEKIFQLEI